MKKQLKPLIHYRQKVPSGLNINSALKDARKDITKENERNYICIEANLLRFLSMLDVNYIPINTFHY